MYLFSRVHLIAGLGIPELGGDRKTIYIPGNIAVDLHEVCDALEAYVNAVFARDTGDRYTVCSIEPACVLLTERKLNTILQAKQYFAL